MSKSPVILCSHEASGAMRSRLRAAGYDAWSCDLRAADDGSPYHLQCNVFDIISCGWDLAIFHPDCTYQTHSAGWAYPDPDFIKYPGVGYHQRTKPGTLTGEARRTRRILDTDEWRRLDAASAYIKARIWENPIGAIWKNWKPYTQIVQPYQFGDDASKATCLRIEGLPALVNTKYFPPRLVCSNCRSRFPWGTAKCPVCRSERLLPRWGNQTDSGQNRLSPSVDRWAERSDTFPGIAQAIVDQLAPHIPT